MQIDEDDLYSRRRPRRRERGLIEVIAAVVAGVVGLLILRLIIMSFAVDTMTSVVTKETGNIGVAIQQMNERNMQNARDLNEKALQMQAENTRKQEEKILQAKQEARLTSDKCKFWWQQNDTNPSDRAAAEKQKSCYL